jgi:hypothetical protein
MFKTITLLRGLDTETYESFHSRIQTITNQLIQKTKPSRLSYTITLEKPPKLSVIPFQKSKIGVLSVYSHNQSNLDFMAQEPGFGGAYQVTEAFPVKYGGEIRDGMKMPGICLLTLFRKKKKITYDKFIHRWHNGHSPLTLKIHPIYHYNRNTIDAVVHEGPEHYDGIVEEHCRTNSDLLNPFRFFGKPWMVPVNMVRVYADVKSFLDYPSIESYLVQEFVVMAG